MIPRVTSLAAAVLAAAASTRPRSSAATQIIPTRAQGSPQASVAPIDEFAGPAIAGDSVVWVEQRPAGGYRVLVRNAGGTRELARGLGRKHLTLAAGGERIGLLTEREIRAGTLTTPFNRLADCSSATGCTGAANGIAVGDDAIAFQWARSGMLGVDVVNFTPAGTTSTRTFAGATGLFALAGRFLAAGNFDQTKLDVLDHVTGEPIYSVARGGGVFDIQYDGTTVFQASRTELAYASVAQPFAHRLGFGQAGPGARSDSASVIAGDRIVITDGRRFALETLTGSVRNFPVVPGLRGGFEEDELVFDGSDPSTYTVARPQRTSRPLWPAVAIPRLPGRHVRRGDSERPAGRARAPDPAPRSPSHAAPTPDL